MRWKGFAEKSVRLVQSICLAQQRRERPAGCRAPRVINSFLFFVDGEGTAQERFSLRETVRVAQKMAKPKECGCVILVFDAKYFFVDDEGTAQERFRLGETVRVAEKATQCIESVSGL